MDRFRIKVVMASVGLMAVYSASAAEESYRFLHVTISTPWYLFIFLLGGVLSPFILMAILVWYSAMRKSKRKADDSEPDLTVE